MAERIIRGHLARSLCRDLALGNETQEALAEKYGVTRQTICYHGQRNREEIAAIKENIDDEFAGMWIAQKQARVAEYKADVERVNAALDKLDVVDPKLLRAKNAALKASAEEMGQLPAKTIVQVSSEPVAIRFPDVDMGSLMGLIQLGDD